MTLGLVLGVTLACGSGSRGESTFDSQEGPGGGPAESFPFGQVGSVCVPDYAPFFEEAVSVIDTACTVFRPPR